MNAVHPAVILGHGPGIQPAATPIPIVLDSRRDGENDATENCFKL